jgi:hypothetical protein
MTVQNSPVNSNPPVLLKNSLIAILAQVCYETDGIGILGPTSAAGNSAEHLPTKPLWTTAS